MNCKTCDLCGTEYHIKTPFYYGACEHCVKKYWGEFPNLKHLVPEGNQNEKRT